MHEYWDRKHDHDCVCVCVCVQIYTGWSQWGFILRGNRFAGMLFSTLVLFFLAQFYLPVTDSHLRVAQCNHGASLSDTKQLHLGNSGCQICFPAEVLLSISAGVSGAELYSFSDRFLHSWSEGAKNGLSRLWSRTRQRESLSLRLD